MILVCVLSYQRPHYLAQTIEAFTWHNEKLFGRHLNMVALDQCSSDATVGIFENHRRYFAKVYITHRNLGIGWGFSQLVELSHIHKADFLLFLEDDWLCQIPVAKHLTSMLDLFHAHRPVGALRLRSMDDAVATVNHVTMQPVETERWHEDYLIGNYHYVFNPHLVRTEVARSMIPVSGEHHAQLCYHALGMQTAQLRDRMFVHIGEHRAPGRISRLPAPRPVVPHELVAHTNEFLVPLPIMKTA